MELASLIEAILFYRAGPMKTGELGKMLGKKPDELDRMLTALGERLTDRGIRLVCTEDTVALATAPEASNFIEALRKEELEGDLGKATLETLTMVLYRAPVGKSEIDYIRGVNSASSIRTLLVRGLIERKRSEETSRRFVYVPTLETLAYLGISKAGDLPEYREVREEVSRFRRELSSGGGSAFGGQNANDEELVKPSEEESTIAAHGEENA